MRCCLKSPFHRKAFVKFISENIAKEFVNGQQFTSTTDIINSMKELFSDVPQTVMEADLEEKLGYEKSERMSDNTKKGMSKNYRKLVKIR